MSFDYKKMDTAADEALVEFAELEKQYPEAIAAFRAWLAKWYQKAGYKRLCRGILIRLR